MPDETLESEDESRTRRAAERVYGSFPLDEERELLLEVWMGITTGCESPPGKPPGIASDRTEGVPPYIDGGRGTPAGPTVLPPYVEGGSGTPAGPIELPPLGDGGPVATNPGGNWVTSLGDIISDGMTGLVGVGGSFESSSREGSGRSASSALRKDPCVSAASMFDSGRDCETISKLS